MALDKKDPATHRLFFGVQRSQRYHDRRLAHYEFLHRVTNVSAVLIAGIVLFELAGAESPSAFKWLAAVAAVLAAFDVVVGFSRQAELHRDLKRKFAALEAEMETGSLTVEHATARRLVIEADEPPVFHALNTLAHNELCIALGHKWSDEPCHLTRIGWFRRRTANWYHWPDFHSNS
jgi:hypothetical protein